MDLSQIRIKRYRNSRSIKIRISPEGEISVTAPQFLPEKKIYAFIDQHRSWIDDKQKEIEHNQKNLTAVREQLPFRGKNYLFRLAVKPGKTGVKITSETITVTTPSEEHSAVRSVLEKFYKKQAKDRFEKRVPLLADLVNSNVKRVTIRSQRTRWGSCSSRNTISLNWRLILCPDWVSDYVIYHELAHLVQMNHSPAFWQLVKDYFPRYQEAEQWLKKNGQLLKF